MPKRWSFDFGGPLRHCSRRARRRKRSSVASVALAVALGCMAACATRQPSTAVGVDMRPAASVSSASAVQWRTWSSASFDEARAAGKLLLVDVGIEGCTACRWMLEDTYGDPAVVARVDAHFVAIAVDAEARPDLGELYSAWGWPATIVLTPDGQQVFAMRGNKRPKGFVEILDKLVAAQAAGDLEGVDAEAITSGSSADADATKLRSRTRAQLDRAYDGEHAGWGGNQKMPLRAQFDALAVRAAQDPAARARALATAEAYAQQLDPVWGGLYIAVIGGGWDGRRIVEKRIAEQAAGVRAFATAYAWTGEAKWLERIEQVDSYVVEFLRDEDGAFFTSQEDDAPDLPTGMTAGEYYTLDDAGRRAFGLPPVDHAVYTHKNGEMIRAYAHAYAITGDPRWRERATAAAGALLGARKVVTGPGRARMDQARPRAATTGDARMRELEAEPRTYLEAQAGFGLALMELYSATGDAQWLDAARELGAHMQATLFDVEQGAYLSSDDPGLALAGLRSSSVEASGLAAHFALRLGTLDKDDALREAALRGLAAVAGDKQLRAEGRMIGEFGLASELVAVGLLEFSIVGDPADPLAAQLFAAAAAVAEPRALVHFEAAGRYPQREQPTLWICSEVACSTPISGAQAVADKARAFAKAEQSAPEGH